MVRLIYFVFRGDMEMAGFCTVIESSGLLGYL